MEDGDPLVSVTFKVIGEVNKDTVCALQFTADSAKVCYMLTQDVTAATTEDGSITITPTLYDVVLTGDNTTVIGVSNGAEASASDPSSQIGLEKAIFGYDYTAKIENYNPDNYEYTVTLKIDGTAKDAPGIGTDGTVKIDKANITGKVELTVTAELQFGLQTHENYVNGWTLITVNKLTANTKDPVYTYDGKMMYYKESYGAYAILISGSVTGETEARGKVALSTESKVTLADDCDVNATGKVDYSDTLLTYRCTVLKYGITENSMDDMAAYLRADVNKDHTVTTDDVNAIDAAAAGTGRTGN